MRCPKSAVVPFGSADFDRGSNFMLAVSATGGARIRYPRHAPRAVNSTSLLIDKKDIIGRFVYEFELSQKTLCYNKPPKG